MMDLEVRMKSYEEATRSILTPRTPVIVRVDGKAFSKYTSTLNKPFDQNFISVMEAVAIALCTEIQGAQLAYVQSDEVSVLLHGYKKFDSQPWFGNQIQKIVSTSAAIAAATFTAKSWRLFSSGNVHESSAFDDIRPAYFDARAFALPESEVANYFIWRQQDATRNSVQMLASSLFSHKQLQGKNVPTMKQMCSDANNDWDALTPSIKKGRCVRRHDVDGMRSGWFVDTNVPVFSSDRSYIEQHLALQREEMSTKQNFDNR